MWVYVFYLILNIGPCDILNGGCEQICIPIGKNRVCKCEYGYQLDLISKKTCASSKYNTFRISLYMK